MTDISAFATGTPVLHNNGPTWTFIASGTITAGQVVAIDATGVSNTVRAAVAESGEQPVGVAVTSATDGGYVTVALDGSVVYFVNADDTSTGDAGDWVEVNDCAVGGTVSVASLGGQATTSYARNCVGYLVEDLAAGSYAKGVVSVGPRVSPNSD